MSTPERVAECVEAIEEYARALHLEELAAVEYEKAKDRKQAAWGRIRALARKPATPQK